MTLDIKVGRFEIQEFYPEILKRSVKELNYETGQTFVYKERKNECLVKKSHFLISKLVLKVSENKGEYEVEIYNKEGIDVFRKYYERWQRQIPLLKIIENIQLQDMIRGLDLD